MGAIERKLAARGLAVVQGAMNPDPRVAEFARTQGATFPIGTAADTKAREFMQISIMRQTAYLPWFAVVDRKGMIREEHYGDEGLFQGDEGRKMEALLEKYLAERAGSPGAGSKKR